MMGIATGKPTRLPRLSQEPGPFKSQTPEEVGRVAPAGYVAARRIEAPLSATASATVLICSSLSTAPQGPAMTGKGSRPNLVSPTVTTVGFDRLSLVACLCTAIPLCC